MKYTLHRELNKQWSTITMGCWQIAPSGGWGDICPPEDADRVIKTALEMNISAFDTAEGYGDGESERRLSKALGNKKDDVIIISKIWPDAEIAIESYKERLENSLRALNRDYVDVYLVHWPGDYFNSPEKSEKLCQIMFRLKAEGKVKIVGLSNFKSQDIKRLGERAPYFSINQVPYSIVKREYECETMAICEKNDIQYMSYSPTGQGLMGGRFDKEALKSPTRQNNKLFHPPYLEHAVKVYEIVKKVAEEKNCNPIEIAVAWVIRQKNILTAIVGSRKPEQVREFAQTSEIELSDEQINRLNSASNSFIEATKTFN
jgi:aryl-alcohol dehydrogenase-like predicted oxidoreductase